MGGSAISEINAPATLTWSGGSLSFNAYGSPYYFHFTAVTGLDQAPLRAPVEPKPHDAGAIWHPFLKDARHITIEGKVVAESLDDRNDACDALIAGLEAIEQADGTYSWTPTGGSLKSLTVRCDVPVQFTGANGPLMKDFIFGLVAGNPVIS